jgi:hypothetical protein
VVRLREWADDRDGRPRRGAVPGDRPGLAQVSVSARECLGSKCPDRVDCFSEQAREAAKEADVVVANHTLLALDVFTGVSVLPERDAVVLDEAHEFVDSVTDALSHELRLGDVRRAVSAVTDLVSEATLSRLEAARDGLEGVPAAGRAGVGARPGPALAGRPRHARDGRRAASAEITRELAPASWPARTSSWPGWSGPAPPGRRWPRRPARSARRRWPRPSTPSRTGRAPGCGSRRCASAARWAAGCSGTRRWWRPRRPWRSAGPSGTPRASSG